MNLERTYTVAELLFWAQSNLCECNNGYPDELRTYYKTSGRETRESLYAEQQWHANHMYCYEFENGYRKLIQKLQKEN